MHALFLALLADTVSTNNNDSGIFSECMFVSRPEDAHELLLQIVPTCWLNVLLAFQ